MCLNITHNTLVLSLSVLPSGEDDPLSIAFLFIAYSNCWIYCYFEFQILLISFINFIDLSFYQQIIIFHIFSIFNNQNQNYHLSFHHLFIVISSTNASH